MQEGSREKGEELPFTPFLSSKIKQFHRHDEGRNGRNEARNERTLEEGERKMTEESRRIDWLERERGGGEVKGLVCYRRLIIQVERLLFNRRRCCWIVSSTV